MHWLPNSIAQELPRQVESVQVVEKCIILSTPNVHYHIHKSPLMNTMIHLAPVENFTYCIFKIHVTSSSQLSLRLQNGAFHWILTIKTPASFLSLPSGLQARPSISSWFNQPNDISLIIQIILYSSSLCNCHLSSVTLFLLGSNIFLSSLFIYRIY